MNRSYKTSAYRYPGEFFILLLTLLLVAGVVIFTVAATACLSGVFILAFVLLSYYLGRSHHQSLVRRARQVTARASPQIDPILREASARLQPGDVLAYIAPGRVLNAYTFGLSSPKVVVVYSGLLDVMDRDELSFILGHELGHVALGHTWLNSLVGGIAGVPASWSAGMLMAMAFLWWNRACEYSADRAGLLACGKPEKAVSALVKLGAGPRAGQSDLSEVYRRIDAEDDNLLGSISEMMGTHPMLIKRIQAVRKYAGSSEYRRLKKLVDRNLQV
ncbi:MAG: M48 family metallopeptidase [Anaerolineales bacterium]|jgi:Zn-dependent protease with chaperone function